MLSKELRSVRVLTLITAIVTVYLALGLAAYKHWTTLIHNLRYLLFG
jgi:hypothetical protein